MGWRSLPTYESEAICQKQKRIRPDACVRCDASHASQKRPEIMAASFMDTEIAHLVRKSLGHWLLWCCQQALCRLE